MKRLNKKGFTLVELLAVIVILALLIVVAVSTVGNVQNNAKKSAMTTEGKKILSKYLEDYQLSQIYDKYEFTYAPGTKVKDVTTVKFEDGNYKMFISLTTAGTLSGGTYCIDDGNGYIQGTIKTDNSIDGTYTTGTCASASGPTA